MNTHFAMREYLLLLMIAAFGIGGLLSIHQEVKERENYEENYLLNATFCISTDDITSSDETVLFVSNAQEDDTSIQFTIADFDDRCTYLVDNGMNTKIEIDKPEFSLRFENQGDYMVKLIKNEVLIDATMIHINHNEAGEKIISF